MKNKIVLIVAFIVLFSISSAYGQNMKEVILSSKVGIVIDESERKQFQLFPKIKGFTEARLYLDSASGYYAKVRYKNDDNMKKDTLIYYSETEIFRLAEQIRFFNEINNGRHYWGEISTEVKIQDNTVYIVLTEAINSKLRETNTINPVNPIYISSKKYPVELPHVRYNNSAYKIKKEKMEHDIGLGFSMAYIDVDLSPINSYFDNVENYIKSKGFDVHKSNLNINISTLPTFNAYLKLYKTLGLFLDVGVNYKEDFDFYYASLSLQYRFNIKKLNWLSPNIALGYLYCGYSVARGYYDWNQEQTQYLDTIKSEGGSSGLLINTGVDINVVDFSENSSLVLNVFSKFALLKEQKSWNYEYNTTLKLSNISIGAGFKVYF